MKQACLVVLLLTGVTAAAAAASSASLRLVDRAPVTVRGTNFSPGERVTVVVATGGSRATRVVHAGTAGGFTARFRMSLGRCSRYVIQAYGGTGTRARLLSRISLGCVSDRAGPETPSP